MAQNVHLPNFAAIENCELIAIAEKRSSLARKVAARYGVSTTYGHHSELAEDPNIDAVALSADYAEQGEIAADLLRAGKHVFMEKPMAVSMHQANRILEAARSTGARLMIAYMKRYDAGNVLFRDTIARWKSDKRMGELLYARNHGFCGDWLAALEPNLLITTDEALERVSPLDRLPQWLPQQKASAYLGYLQQYSHNINLLRYLLGAEKLEQLRVESVNLNEDGLTGVVVLELAGVRCVIESASTDFHAWDEHTQVYFQRGWVKAVVPPAFNRSAYSEIEIYERGSVPSYNYPVPAPLPAWHYREEAWHFVSALRTGASFRSSGEDALLDVSLNEEIYKRYLGIKT
jgi:predicted dehydrogenase